MNLYDIKEDWDDVKKRWEAWWNACLYDRPLLLVTAPKDNPEIPAEITGFIEEKTDWTRKWTDTNYLIEKTLYDIYTVYYGGETVPMFIHGWSVGHALTFGCEPHFEQNTIWADKLPIGEGESFPAIKFDENNKWWLKICEIEKTAALTSKKRFFLRAKWGNGAGDILGACRGNENFMVENFN
ncbi:MAG: hypothetical protein FWD78_07275 [Treponema sp.]|nr:hypothetical protein [Treponema sp.]